MTKLFTTSDVPNLDGTALLASIGLVCLQWARLEMTAFGILTALEKCEPEKGAVLFGGLDLKPRINTAIRLAEAIGLPGELTAQLRSVRKTLQGKGKYDGLDQRRNLIIHGAHKDSEGRSTTLTMMRWPGDKRNTTMSAEQIAELANEIHDLGTRCWELSEAIWKWQLRDLR